MSSKGFTLIELILVLVLVGILSSYAVVRFPGKHEFLLRGQTELLLTHIRHSQRLAITWHQPLRMSFSRSNYSLVCVSAGPIAPCNNSPVIDPLLSMPFSINLDSEMSLSGASSIDFDSAGRPVLGGILLDTDAQVLLSMGGDTHTVTIHAISGFVDYL